MALIACPFKEFSCAVMLPSEGMLVHLDSAADLHASLVQTKKQVFVAQIKHFKQALAQSDARFQIERNQNMKMLERTKQLELELKQALKQKDYAEAQSQEIEALLVTLVPPISPESLQAAQEQRVLNGLKSRIAELEETVRRQQDEIKLQRQRLNARGKGDSSLLWQLCHPQLVPQKAADFVLPRGKTAQDLSSVPTFTLRLSKPADSFLRDPKRERSRFLKLGAGSKILAYSQSSSAIDFLETPEAMDIEDRRPISPEVVKPVADREDSMPVPLEAVKHAENLRDSYLRLVRYEEEAMALGKLPLGSSMKADLLAELEHQPKTREWLEQQESLMRQTRSLKSRQENQVPEQRQEATVSRWKDLPAQSHNSFLDTLAEIYAWPLSRGLKALTSSQEEIVAPPPAPSRPKKGFPVIVKLADSASKTSAIPKAHDDHAF
eukprot:gb/GEZN01007114.1/.p1 GENE.gb/GEZN01007114.1/~~gb/GEZN01007114.1/.p1  ORF type:complete len:437 (-),score=71.47 gb/GEZN01007114.1/:148-1458(-)